MSARDAADAGSAEGASSLAMRSERQVLRRTRWRLALWSGTTTLIVLLILGVALYAVVERQIADDSERQLRARAASLNAIGRPERAAFVGEGRVLGALRIATDVGRPGYVFGGPLSGTIAVIVDGAGLSGDVPASGGTTAGGTDLTGVIGGPQPPPEVASLPLLPPLEQLDGHAELRAEGTVSTTTLDGTPVRVLSVPIDGSDPALRVHVISDMTAERRALDGLLLVLLLGGVVVVVAAAAAGWMYAGRALVPIRDSLRRQREFAADASHELRTPLTALRNDLEALRLLPQGERTAQEALDEAIDETDRMSALLDSLLLLARADADAVPLEMGPLDLADEASSVLEGLGAAAAARGISTELDIEPTPIVGDAARIRQLVTILADNAIRYGRNDGHVWVSARLEDGEARLTVADDGPGIAPHDRARIFERFGRGSDTAGDGSGLGLSIAAWIVAAHGGHIAVGQRDGGGARFEVTLPA